MWPSISSFLFVAALAGHVAEASFLPPSPSSCTTSTIRLSVKAQNQRFADSVQPPTSPLDVANYYRAQFAQTSNLTAEITLTGANAVLEVSGTYNIFTKVCLPKTKWSGVVQVLVHGSVDRSGSKCLDFLTCFLLRLDVDHRYWENPYNATYSWIDAANKAGHATISYDRLGG